MPTPQSEWPMDPIGRKLHEIQNKKNEPVILGPPPVVMENEKFKEEIEKNGGLTQEQLDYAQKIAESFSWPKPDETYDG